MIVAIGELPVRRVSDLLGVLNRCEPGQEVTVTVLRDGRRAELPATLDAGRRESPPCEAYAALLQHGRRGPRDGPPRHT